MGRRAALLSFLGPPGSQVLASTADFPVRPPGLPSRAPGVLSPLHFPHSSPFTPDLLLKSTAIQGTGVNPSVLNSSGCTAWAVICKFCKLFHDYLNSNTIKGSVTSVTPFQPASTRPPAPTSAEDPVPLWNPIPSFFLWCPCLPWLNSVEYRALNPQLPVFLAKKWGEIHPSGGDPESRSSPGLPLDDTSVSARSGSSCRPDSLVERGLGPHPVLLGEGWSSRHASHVVPPPQPRTPCAPSPAVRTLLPCSGSPWTPGQAGAWLSSRTPWWPLRCCLPAPSGLFPLPAPPPPRCT